MIDGEKTKIQIFVHVTERFLQKIESFTEVLFSMCLLLQVTMSFSQPDRALLVKLFYQNNNSAVLQKFRTLKGVRNGPLTVKILRIMIIKFEKTGSLNVCLGRGRKLVSVLTFFLLIFSLINHKSPR